MKQKITSFQFCDDFPKSYQNNFTYEGKKALFEYLERLEKDTGQEFEYDPIAFCCEYTEYKNLKELQKDYSDIESIGDLENNTTVIPIYDCKGTKLDSFIIQAY